MKQLDASWTGIKEIYVYGWGNMGKKCIKKLVKDFKIIGIIDNDEDKWGIYEGIPVKGLSDIGDKLKKYKIVVMTGGRTYADVRKDLQQMKLNEFQDFCSIEMFISEWYWENKGQNCILEIHTAVTMHCTFQCKKCNMFVPYYKEKVQYTLEELKQDYDLLFSFVDYLFSIELLGGEPFLYKDLGGLLKYLCECYSEKIGAIGIITNGSVVPNEELRNILKKYNIITYVSDYSDSIPYQRKLDEFVNTYEKEKLRYEIRPSMQWKDFGFPNGKAVYNTQTTREHMLICAPIFHGLNDKKFYYCHVAWSAEKAGLYQLNCNDYVDLTVLDNTKATDKRKLIMHSLGENMENGHVSLCQVCGGCGEDNPMVIRAGEQASQ